MSTPSPIPQPSAAGQYLWNVKGFAGGSIRNLWILTKEKRPEHAIKKARAFIRKIAGVSLEIEFTQCEGTIDA